MLHRGGHAVLLARVEGTVSADEPKPPWWNTEDLQRDFEVIGFSAPYVVVKMRATGQMGSLQFQHNPRIYWNWVPDAN